MSEDTGEESDSDSDGEGKKEEGEGKGDKEDWSLRALFPRTTGEIRVLLS